MSLPRALAPRPRGGAPLAAAAAALLEPTPSAVAVAPYTTTTAAGGPSLPRGVPLAAALALPPRTPAAGAQHYFSSSPAAASSAPAPAAAGGGDDRGWFAHRRQLYDAVYAVAGGDDPFAVVNAIDTMEAFGYRPSRDHYLSAIRALGRLGHTQSMLRVYALCVGAGHAPSPSLLNSMLFAFARRLDVRGVHYVSAQIEAAGQPLSDDAFKRLVFAHFCVGDDDRAFKILDMYRASGGPVADVMQFALNNVGALANAADGDGPGGRAIPKGERQSVAARVVRKLVTYLSLSPSPSPEAVAVLLNNLVFNTKRSLLVEALAYRRLVEMAPPQLLERAIVALTRSALFGLLSPFSHGGHVKLTLHEFAAGVVPTAELMQARMRGLRHVVDPAWDERGAAASAPPADAASDSRLLQQEGEQGASDGADVSADSDGNGGSDGAPAEDAAAAPEGSANSVAAATATQQPRPAAAPARERPPPPMDADLRGLTSDSIFTNLRRRVRLKTAALTSAAVAAGGGGADAAEAAAVAATAPLSETAEAAAGQHFGDATALRTAAGLYVGPLLGALEPGSAFTSWRTDTSLRPEERTDRAMRFAAGLLLHLEAIGHDVSDATYRVLFATLAAHKKTVAAAQVALRLEARGVTLSDAYGVDKVIETLRIRSSPDDHAPLAARLCGLLPPPLLAAYRDFAARSRPRHAHLIPHAAPPPPASPAQAAAASAVAAVSEPPPPGPAPAPVRGKAAVAAASAAGADAPTDGVAAAAAPTVSGWEAAGYPTLHLSALAPAEEDKSLRLQLRSAGFWALGGEPHPSREHLVAVERERAEAAAARAAASDASRARRYGDATTTAAGGPVPPSQFMVGGQPGSAPRYAQLPPTAPQPPFSDVLPGTMSLNPRTLEAVAAAEAAALRAAAAAAPGDAATAAYPAGIIVAERWQKRTWRYGDRDQGRGGGAGAGKAVYVHERPPYIHWLPPAPGSVPPVGAQPSAAGAGAGDDETAAAPSAGAPASAASSARANRRHASDLSDDDDDGTKGGAPGAGGGADSDEDDELVAPRGGGALRRSRGAVPPVPVLDEGELR